MIKYTLLLLFGLLVISQSKAHVNLNNPLGGETFIPGDTINIKWQVVINHTILNWDLSFSSDGGATWSDIKLDMDAATRNYQWVVPATATSQGRIRIVMDNAGADYNDISTDFTISITTGISNSFASNEINVYPNPFTEYATLEIDNLRYGHQNLTLYNTHGQLVRTINNITTDKVIIYRENLKSGLYFFQLSTNGAVLTTGKLTIK